MPCAVILTAALTACSGANQTHTAPDTAPRTHASARSATNLGTPDCAPASPITRTNMGPEIEGTGHGATLYGVVMTTTPLPLRAREQVKIVWRMTGTGPLTLTATSPQGKPVPLPWGPEPHDSSNYNRPGQEWGAGYDLTAAGCWHLHAQRGSAYADVWLPVSPK